MTGTWWIAAGLYLFGACLALTGLYLKSGPETAMICGGLIFLWFANMGFKISDADD